MWAEAGVTVLYLPPNSPDLNSIEEFSAELNTFIKTQWHEFEDSPYQDFKVYLEWCVSMAGGKKRSARGHFGHSG